MPCSSVPPALQWPSACPGSFGPQAGAKPLYTADLAEGKAAALYPGRWAGHCTWGVAGGALCAGQQRSVQQVGARARGRPPAREAEAQLQGGRCSLGVGGHPWPGWPQCSTQPPAAWRLTLLQLTLRQLTLLQLTLLQLTLLPAHSLLQLTLLQL